MTLVANFDAYADESGDPGYRFESSSSSLFVVGIVVPDQPEQLIDRMVSARRTLGKPTAYEFHFRQTDSRIRGVFFSALSTERISLMVAVIHKHRAPRDFRHLGKMRLYSHAIAGLALRSPFELRSCKLYLDGSGKQKAFLAELKTSVRWACRVAGYPEQSFEDIRMLNSSHLLVQCADMLAGAASAAFSSDKADCRWWDMISEQAVTLWHERFTDGSEKETLPASLKGKPPT
jgi:hypothetical protein